MSKLIRKFLNYYGYYRIEQLRVGGYCGCCGRTIKDHIYYNDSIDNWCNVSICYECEKEYNTLKL